MFRNNINIIRNIRLSNGNIYKYNNKSSFWWNRTYSTTTPPPPQEQSQSESMDEYELKIYNILQQELNPINLKIKDVSGGCGSMFSIFIESEKFKGLTMIKQHRLVNEILKDEIKKWHGLQLRTKKVNM
ncbi:conserved hypothetical protein [Candida dubliniensis CD36]|uniref:BolA-like protein n=1 Tax=Candida dubliniensis (strain CD36 / ATCC MYA-646 / CBS 7987 / NCPF 3949 / NRRL Y-17841) TaxID=573826 RepID=B9WK30_CANDC|nr:conserved hypothetical protein [Candida dubliniensis CD36]CAX40681.1 conserved hypothetical protein [Candida dubliniensis CD36]